MQPRRNGIQGQNGFSYMQIEEGSVSRIMPVSENIRTVREMQFVCRLI